MADKAKKGKKTLKIVLSILLTAVILAGAAGGYLYYRHLVEERQKREEALESLTKALSVPFLNAGDVNAKFTGTAMRKDDYGGVFEYGTAVIDPAELVGEHKGTLTVQGAEKIDTTVPGDYDVTFIVTDTTEYGDEVTKETSKHYRVEDTARPVIEFDKNELTFTEGDDFDPKSNIVSVTDPVDGDLEYEIDTDLKMDEPGSYTVTVRAKDRNGNETGASFTVHVEEKPAPISNGGGGGGGGGSSSSGYDLPYEIYVNCAANTVTVYERGNGDYSNPVIAFKCSTGSGTPRGTYYTYDDPDNSVWSPYYPWWPLYGGVYGMYAYGIVGDILFHSVPYYSPDPSDLEYDEFNKLGTSASMGCVRLCVRDVKWIFDHCGHGTRVVFYDNASNPGPLATEYVPTIDTSSPNRGWDPTDPNPENPWNS